MVKQYLDEGYCFLRPGDLAFHTPRFLELMCGRLLGSHLQRCLFPPRVRALQGPQGQVPPILPEGDALGFKTAGGKWLMVFGVEPSRATYKLSLTPRVVFLCGELDFDFQGALYVKGFSLAYDAFAVPGREVATEGLRGLGPETRELLARVFYNLGFTLDFVCDLMDIKPTQHQVLTWHMERRDWREAWMTERTIEETRRHAAFSADRPRQ